MTEKKYILRENFALRSYNKLPRMIIKKESEIYDILLKKEWDFLLKCDGNTFIDPEDEAWVRKSRIRMYLNEAKEGDTLSEWQKHKTYDNLFFPSVEWRITDRCNYNCLHCYNAADESANADIWEYDEALEFLDEVRSCGINRIILSGGEPMMHKDFLKIVKAIYDRDMYVSEIVTNGYYLNSDILDELASYGIKPLFKVSFDGFGYHDWMRNYAGAEKKAIEAFELLHEKNFPILVNAQVNRKNLDSISKTMDYFDDLGVNTLRYIRTTEVPRWVLKAGDAALSYDEYYEAMFDVIKKFNSKERTMNLILWQFGTLRPGTRSFSAICNNCSQDAYRPTMPACNVVREQICIGAGGNIYPCSQVSGIYDSRNICLGNVKRDSLQSLLKDGPYVKLAAMTVDDVRKNNPKCDACNHFRQCHGGCRGLAYLTTGDFYGTYEKMCDMYTMDIESRMQELLPGWKNITASPGHDTIIDDNISDKC